MLEPSPITAYHGSPIRVIFQGYHPVGGHRLSIALHASPFDLVKDFWVRSRVEVADCYGIQCGKIPWLADEIKWEAITVEQGIQLSSTAHEVDAPFWYSDLNRSTLGLSRKSIYVNIRTVAQLSGNPDALYMLCHRVAHIIYAIPLLIQDGYFQWVFCTGGTFANSGKIQVRCQPEDDYNTFIQLFLETPDAQALGSLTCASLRCKKSHLYDDFRAYFVPMGIEDEL
jgi:hypothetical protein